MTWRGDVVEAVGVGAGAARHRKFFFEGQIPPSFLYYNADTSVKGNHLHNKISTAFADSATSEVGLTKP
jgi:hypothetical protein